MNLLACTVMSTLLTAGVVSLTSCANSSPRDQNISINFQSAVRSAIADYDSGDRLTQTPRWVLTSCVVPTPAEIAGLRTSAAGPKSPHGRKLYHLYASSGYAYLGATTRDEQTPVGLTLVKEAHRAERLPDHIISETTTGAVRLLNDANDYAMGFEVDSLYVMTKVGRENTPKTDRGWIYGVILADRTTVLDAGMIASCVNCHAKAPHSPLFGMADDDTP